LFRVGFFFCALHQPIVGSRQGNEQFPLSGEGVLIELVQAPPHVIRALSEK